MKMGRKYQVDSVCEAVTCHLKRQWPQTAIELVRSLSDRALVRNARGDSEQSKHDYRPEWRSFPEPASTIRLATDFDIPSVLPSAFYLLSTIEPDDKWPQRTTQSWHADRLARWDLLGDNDMLRYFKGKYILAKELSMMEDIFDEVLCSCETEWVFTEEEEEAGGDALVDIMETWQTPCMRTIDLFAQKFFQESRLRQDILQHADPVTTLLTLQKRIFGVTACDLCRYAAAKRIQYNIRTIWGKLPKLFNL